MFKKYNSMLTCRLRKITQNGKKVMCVTHMMYGKREGSNSSSTRLLGLLFIAAFNIAQTQHMDIYPWILRMLPMIRFL